MPYVVAYRRRLMGKSFDPAYADFTAACASDATLLPAAQAKIAELEQGGGPRVAALKDCDHESNVLHDCLSSMVAAATGATT